MLKKSVLLLSFMLSFSALAFGQTKTVTNADLEKFRQKRLQSEKNYRENYERLGFPSPEERERKRVADEQNLIEFSQQLEAQRLEREAIQSEAENQALWLQSQLLQSRTNRSNYDSNGYFYGGYVPFYNGYYGGYRAPRRDNYSSTYSSGFSNAYPWMIIPQFRTPRLLNQRPRQNFAPRNVNPRVRTGRGRF